MDDASRLFAMFGLNDWLRLLQRGIAISWSCLD
jgi:hypothetical protein